MCWEMDYRWFAEQQKAQAKQQAKEQEKRKQEQKQAQRTDAIDRLLSEANQQADKADEKLPDQETVPAK